MYGWQEFAAQLLGAANGALPFIGAGVLAALVIFAVLYGIVLALRMFNALADDRAAQSEGFDSAADREYFNSGAWDVDNLDPQDPEDWR